LGTNLRTCSGVSAPFSSIATVSTFPTEYLLEA
jgi:hypothetical protein